jgi:hypothetical protein
LAYACAGGVGLSLGILILILMLKTANLLLETCSPSLCSFPWCPPHP